jgi:hypothetical protein
MRRWFLSYNSQDLRLMESLEAGLRRKDPDAGIFFAPKSLRAGGLWLPELARGIAEATAFVLLVGEKGIGPWQAMEYYEALDRRVKQQISRLCSYCSTVSLRRGCRSCGNYTGSSPPTRRPRRASSS